ncbi:MAG: bifunctional acetate--CoA ligase family protein/GNAT family N-acetyltransferase [Comamonadaceae bacterium]|jgi:acetyltransferase|uniref:bifunctional acetate--CoA ligase family protein/GNAT family N-acetyltransferase n=1 Tax=Candidatus Skiveiella danica TaxID=3386177 RepID=UPI001B7C62E5|nr:bifunctional acetate--CoA ligase family protein/GNAT family N-acetyltransferase [Comamonadaceae bacterium]MBK9198716.1 bifunctional acetate--CoA ligase family protein/GNAT family N-acetyltransferase [Betaproteobacteria bacterium]MBP6357221.1 bifunctional acetate--CoA ligase family protein/GNAT family N-acetyltransferase [Burkholderiaceae bacterium]MBK6559067.1 bifunctional acetate--CoA ligase family protein/GNAT family N-acetyltransferase [Comamonadaceae bacterium]MBK6927835.1 bifunctional a
MDKHYLHPLFSPESIAVFAGQWDDPTTQTPQAQTLLTFLRAQRFSGTLTFLDIHTTGTLADLAQTRADLAIIALPHEDVAAALDIAGRIKCRAAVVISTGINATLASELNQLARHHGMYLLGPNCLGFQRPRAGLNASVAGPMATPGPLALVSQSGALTSSILDWASQNAVGFSTVVSLGPNTSVDIAQVLDFLASDQQTHSIVVYLEGISNSRRFMSALRAAANAKPVVVLKAGRKTAGNKAARTHSGAIVGSDDVFDAALRRAGAVRVRSFVALFSAAKCLASRYRAVGRRLAIITNGGGPGVLAADWISEINLQLGQLSAASAEALKAVLPAQASLCDLIDLSEDASPEHYRLALDAASKEKEIDGILVIHSPKTGCDAAAVAAALADFKARISKPLLTCWMGDASVGEARTVLNTAMIPTFRTPEAAVGAFGNIASFYQNQQLLQQTPPPLSTLAKPDIEGARLLIESVLAERRNVLTEMESKALLSAFHIPVTKTILARNANEAMMIATQLGFPVALKIDSPDITHKSDVNGVALNVMNAVGVRDTYNDMMQAVKRNQPNARINGVTIQNMARHKRGREIYIGLVTDDPFGPVIAFGAGGTMIELMNDRAMELPPLNQFLARSLIDRARVSETLGEWRGATAVDMDALEHVLLRVSEMVCELPQLREMDINPIIVDESGAVAVDARIVIDNAQQAHGGRTHNYNHLAILPYPAQHEQVWPMRGGEQYTIRPIHPDDADMLQTLVRSLSSESRYFRFVSSMHELPPQMLSRFTLIDYDREMALVAVYTERKAGEDGEMVETSRIVGVSRYITNPDSSSCEFSLVVADDFGGRGLGSRLMLSIMDVAREKGLTEIVGLVLTNNPGMLKLMKSLGYSIKAYPDDPDFRLVTHPL